MQDDLVPCISYENEKLADDEGIRLGMMENNKQRDGINTLLRNGIIGYNLDAKYERLPEIRRIFVNIGEDENASNNTWKLVVDDTHRGNIDIDTSRISYGFSLLKGQNIGLGRKPKRVQFGKSNGDSYKLYMLEKAEYIPENVNFAVASPTLSNFLKMNFLNLSKFSIFIVNPPAIL